MRTRSFVAGLVTAVTLLVLVAVATSRAAPPGNGRPQLVRIYYTAIPELRRISHLDLLEYNNLAERYVLAYVDDAQLQSLRRAGWPVTIHSAQETLDSHTAADLFAGGYHTVEELYARLDLLAADYPTLLQTAPYGESHCREIGGCVLPGGEMLPGFALQAVRVTNTAVPGASDLGPPITRGTKPVFFLMANIHAREISTPEIALHWLEHLLAGYGQDADITWLVDQHELWIVPTANPDGHRIVELGPLDETFALHRKNANQDADNNGELDCPVWPSESYAQFGVDLNRNHSYAWEPGAPLSGLCSLVYPGPEAASEPEVAALQGLVRALIPDQRGPANAAAPLTTTGMFITLHSYSELILRPWAHVSMPAPNEEGLRAIGDKLATYNGYRSCQPGQCLYEAAGTSDDWAYGELGVPAYTFEIGQSFAPPYAEIAGAQWPLNRPAFVYAAKIAGSPYLAIQGPDVTAVSAAAGKPVLTAVIDDTAHGNEIIRGAAYTIDLPIWSPAAVPAAMAAADGAFDSPRELVVAPIPDSLPPGRHIVYVRGRDAAGHWGVTSATFVEGTAVAINYMPLAINR